MCCRDALFQCMDGCYYSTSQNNRKMFRSYFLKDGFARQCNVCARDRHSKNTNSERWPRPRSFIIDNGWCWGTKPSIVYFNGCSSLRTHSWNIAMRCSLIHGGYDWRRRLQSPHHEWVSDTHSLFQLRHAWLAECKYTCAAFNHMGHACVLKKHSFEKGLRWFL